MPNSASAKKRVRQTATRQSRNHWRKNRIKARIRIFLIAVQTRDLDAAESEYRALCGLLDKVSHTSTMHKNTAARRKSRIARRLNALKAELA